MAKLVRHNLDKVNFKEDVNDDDLLDIPAPFRIGLFSPPSRGKTNIILQILLHQDPPFEKIYLYHYDKGSKDYDGVKVIQMDELPDPAVWRPEGKAILIIEDIIYDGLSKIQKQYLDRICGTLSSHHNLSIAYTAQNSTSTPPSFRRMLTHMCIWRSMDMSPLYMLLSRMGLNKRVAQHIFKEYIKDKYDFLVCSSVGHPYMINFDTVINLEENSD